MNSHVVTALFIVTAIALGWVVFVNREQMSEIRGLRAELARNTSANKIERPLSRFPILRS
jgi:hypothetical protein